MAYKTLMLQIYKPSCHKREIMDTAILNYARALQYLLDRYRDDVIKLSLSGEPVTRRLLLSLMDKATLKGLNGFKIQPFKDSLKIDFAVTSLTFIAQKRKNQHAGYPNVFLEDEDFSLKIEKLVKQLDSGLIDNKQFEYEYKKRALIAGRLHPLYFGRYAVNRDYCLLYDEYTDRFYAKLYLMNFSDREKSEEGSASASRRVSLVHVSKGLPAVQTQTGKKRYIVVPLAFGKNQHEDLIRALSNPQMLHTARLLKKKDKYYLMVNVEYTVDNAVEAVTTMGVARNASGGCHYTVCTQSGEIVADERMDHAPDENQKLYFFAKSIVCIALQYQSQVVLEANGGNNDYVLLKQDASLVPITINEYRKLSEILKYKLVAALLPAPIEVSANGLYCTCPKCDNRTYKNCLSSKIFACVECGYASVLESIGSANLAGRIIKYKKDKVPIYGSENESGMLFYNKSIDFEYTLPSGSSDYNQMYYELSLLAHASDKFESSAKKYSILKKLRESPNLCDSVRIVFKSSPRRMF
jgi:putative transposase